MSFSRAFVLFNLHNLYDGSPKPLNLVIRRSTASESRRTNPFKLKNWEAPAFQDPRDAQAGGPHVLGSALQSSASDAIPRNSISSHRYPSVSASVENLLTPELNSISSPLTCAGCS